MPDIQLTILNNGHGVWEVFISAVHFQCSKTILLFRKREQHDLPCFLIASHAFVLPWLLFETSETFVKWPRHCFLSFQSTQLRCKIIPFVIFYSSMLIRNPDWHFPSNLLFDYVEEGFIQTLEMHEAFEVPKQKLKSPRIEFKHVLLFSSLAQIQCFHYLLFWGLDIRNKRHPKNRIQRSG